MPDILHRITVNASSDKVYESITTQKGLSRWWTADVCAEPKEGSIAEFGFQNHSVVFRMRIEKLDAPRSVQWTCVGDLEEWEGTKIVFYLTEIADKRTLLDFIHCGWRSIKGAYPMCNTDWGRLMYYLKDYVEERGNGPMMR